MSIAFKKNHFRIQIRRENLNKILQKKRQQQLSHTEVNQAILQYLNQYSHVDIPKICVLNYELIDEEHLHLFIDLLNSTSHKIDIKKAFNIALLNKVFFYDQRIAENYFNQVTQFAQKILFIFPGPQGKNNKQLNGKGAQKLLYIKPPANLMEDLMLFPNCLIEYWGNYFSKTDQNKNICMRAYCIIMKSFIKWFSQKGSKHQNFSKYSVCFFLRNFFEAERIYMPETYDKYQLYKQFEQLFIRFRIVSISVVIRLLEEQFYCQELIRLMQVITKRDILSKDLLRALRQSQRDKNFFEMLIDGIDNQNILIYKDYSIKERFFHSKQLTQQNLKTLSDLSVQRILKEDVFESIWNSKIKILDTFNNFLIMNYFERLFFQSHLEKIIEKLINVYFYSTQQGKNTIRAQKILCIIFYNILLISEAQFEFEDEEISCLKIQCENQTSIQQRLTDYFLQNIQKIQEIVNKTQYSSYVNIVEMIALLKYFSEFLYDKEVDHKIMNQGRLVMKIFEAFQKNIFDEEQGLKIMDSLFDYLEQLSDRDFDFSQTFNDIQRLKKTQLKVFLTSKQEDLLDEILKNSESK